MASSPHLDDTCQDMPTLIPSELEISHDPVTGLLVLYNPISKLFYRLDPVTKSYVPIDPVPGSINPVAGSNDPVPGSNDPVLGANDPVPGSNDPVLGANDPVPGLNNPGLIDPALRLTDYDQFELGIPLTAATAFPTLDPNTLVAIVTGRIVNEEITQDSRINPKLYTVAAGINARFAPFLDALASLAVADPKGQVVAMAIEFVADIKKLHIAENVMVQKPLIDHITRLLAILKAISTGSDIERRALELEFFKVSFMYSLLKLRKRFSSTLSWMEDFDTDFITEPGEDALKCQVVLSTLLTASETIEKIRIVQNKNPVRSRGAPWTEQESTTRKEIIEKAIPDDEWNTLMFMMFSATPYVQLLLDDPITCNEWAENRIGTTFPLSPLRRLLLNPVPAVVSVSQGVAVPLFRTIEKLTSHHRHVLHLFDYAKSDAGKSDLVGGFQVETRGGVLPAPWLKLPSRDGLEAAILNYLPVGTDIKFESQKITDGIQSQFHNPPVRLHKTDSQQVQGVAHCECVLIAGLTRYNLAYEETRVTYVGVSKLSCAACYAWIQAHNSVHPHHYQTRGSHARWYQGWAMPLLPAEATVQSIDSDMSRQHMLNHFVGREYRKFFDAGLEIRKVALSDSTQAKTRFPDDRWTTQDLQKLNELSIAKRKARATEAMVKQQPKK